MSNLLEYAHYFFLFYYILEYPLLCMGDSCTTLLFSRAFPKKLELRSTWLAGRQNPTPDIDKTITEAEATGKGKYPNNSHSLLNSSRTFYFSSFSNTPITFNVFHLFLDADEQPADNLTKVAAIVINNLPTKTSDISKGVLYNI